MLSPLTTEAAPPQLYHTPGYGAPVRGEPDDLLFLPGYGLSGKDTVVYAALLDDPAKIHPPETLPTQSSANSGIAEAVGTDNAPNSLTVRLPDQMQAGQAYALWVRNMDGEWSEPVFINDARPLWISPASMPATGTLAGLPRALKVMGRNLNAAPGARTQVRLSGPQTVTMKTTGKPAPEAPDRVAHFVAEVELPQKLAPGKYTVSVSRDGKHWVGLGGQRFEVRAVPPSPAVFAVADAQFGGCKPDDELDDTACIASALKAASTAGGGTVQLASGTWRMGNPAGIGGDGVVIGKGVSLTGKAGTVLERGVDWSPPTTRGHPSFTLAGENTISGIRFTDRRRYQSGDPPAPLLRLGFYRGESPRGTAPDAGLVRNVVIDHNVFDRSYYAIADSGAPLRELIIAHNTFGAFTNALDLAGNRFAVHQPLQLEDSIIAHNTFKPGSYQAAKIRQGTIAAQFGAARRVDFSDNIADGADKSFLYSPTDPPGWRAAFFWHLVNNQEMVLVSRNTASCTGDKGGDGEAFAFDNNGNTFAFDAPRTVSAATASTVAVPGPLRPSQSTREVDLARYYVGHWIFVGDGPGVGQTRKITGYTLDDASGEVTFTVQPVWDVAPVPGRSRIDVGRSFWQLYVVGNTVDHRAPPCVKANASGTQGGGIILWAQASDSAIDGNIQNDANGIVLHPYSAVPGPKCAHCEHSSYAVYTSEITGNEINGEHAVDTDCSTSGINLVAGTTEDMVKPTVAAYGLSIAHNRITGADVEGGGSIAVTFAGPGKLSSPLVSNTLIFKNDIIGARSRDLKGCRRPGPARATAIQLGNAHAARMTLLYRNSCPGARTAVVAEPSWGTALCDASGPQSCGCRR